MSEAKHYCIEHGYDSEQEAEEAVPDLKARLRHSLKLQGFWSLAPLPIPKVFGGRAYIDGDCRVIVSYMPPWLPSRWADKFVVRVDTLASEDVTDASGRLIAPPQTEIQARPSGPWDGNGKP